MVNQGKMVAYCFAGNSFARVYMGMLMNGYWGIGTWDRETSVRLSLSFITSKVWHSDGVLPSWYLYED